MAAASIDHSTFNRLPKYILKSQDSIIHIRQLLPVRGPVRGLPPFTFVPFSLRETELVARKQGRYAQKASAGREFQPEFPSSFRRTRRADRAPGRAPLQRHHSVLAQERLARPLPY